MNCMADKDYKVHREDKDYKVEKHHMGDMVVV